MVANQIEREELIRLLAWQHAEGIDEALLDNPASDTPLTLRDFSLQKDSSKQVQQPAAPTEMTTKTSDSVQAAASTVPVSAQTDSDADSVTASGDSGAEYSSPPAMPMELAALTSLEALRDALGRLDQCPLKHTASNMIFADGNPGARLMVIGEIPGREEDRVGLPMVGGAGQLFDRMLSSIGLTRADIYMTSLLPWRPPGNRTPTPEEMDMLLPWLHRHVQLAAPQRVLLLGGGPAKAILPDPGGILKLRGRWKEIDFGDGVLRPTMATLHPSYLLRSPAQKRLAFADLVALADKLG